MEKTKLLDADSSTIIIKKPDLIRNNSVEKYYIVKSEEDTPNKTYSALLLVSLWLFASLFAVAKTEFSANVTGIAVSFHLQDVLFMAFCCWLLHKGLSTRNSILIFPYVLVTLYGMYYNHYRSLLKMMTILKSLRHSMTFPWVALLVSTIGLFIRVVLTLRIIQLAANLWYKKKLENELYQ